MPASGSTSATTLRSQVRRVGRVIWAERQPYLIGSIFVLVSVCTALAYPYLVRLIIDDAIQSGNVHRLNQLSLAVLGVLLTEAASTCGRDYFFGIGAERVGLRVRRLVFEALLVQDIPFFDARDTGAIAARLFGDVPPLEQALNEDFADTLRAAIFSICGTGLLLFISPWLTVVMLLGVPPIAVATSLLGRKVKVLAGDVQRAHAEAGAAATEVLGGVRTVRAFSREDQERSRYHGHLSRALEAARRKMKARAALGGLSLIAGECAALLAIWVGGHMIATGQMTTGALIAFILYALFVARGLRQASRFGGEALRAIGATSWAFDLLDTQPRIPLHGGLQPAAMDGSIVLEHVRFRYPTRPEVEALKGIDLHIAPGEVVAVVGKSGSGKSTLLNLALRFYDPDEGRVLVGGYDVRELDASWLRGHIATVMQEPTLFSRSVRDNISYSLAVTDEPSILEAARLARADEFIDRLPGRYDALVGDRGVRLSGGQRQRLAIARALLRRPRILILDEATSALDAELESLVQSALRRLDYTPTTLIVAHRLSTVATVDRVLVMDEGQIVEQGTHDELLRTSNFYRQLVHTQLVAQ